MHVHLHQSQHRGFISLPSLPALPNLLKPLSSSRYYKDRILVKYSQQEFYNLVANVDDYHKFLPWCTYSKMSEPLPAGSEQNQESRTINGTAGVTVRHGELGIGFNSLQERYVSTVTCQEPWTVRAVSYDSKLFKELATIWKFTPNIPKSTTLDAAMDQELQEGHLLVKFADEHPVTRKPSTSSTLTPPSPQPPTPKQTERQLTAAVVFGEAAVPKLRTPALSRPVAGASTLAANAESPPTETSSNTASPSDQYIPTQERPLPPPPKNPVRRTSSPSNLAIMKPNDYPSCWIDFEIQFEFSSPVHASMSSLFFDQVSKDMLQAFIKRAEVLYGQR
ncbi:Coenzyme Q-binding protein coq10a, mitochondrial [Entomortierella chlamydospora]|uniref:Coenzyme Q-binding protein coq10a, mitochondrial n=1 Tax=Entomortierella chlamydospora TaxID=101097 RepID=A0A9P6N1S4_9FUNG|nr:Coenzyme Q-binding protein coq10a, mitochondrial [Entomortierella chlamydospora]